MSCPIYRVKTSSYDIIGVHIVNNHVVNSIISAEEVAGSFNIPLRFITITDSINNPEHKKQLKLIQGKIVGDSIQRKYLVIYLLNNDNENEADLMIGRACAQLEYIGYVSEEESESSESEDSDSSESSESSESNNSQSTHSTNSTNSSHSNNSSSSLSKIRSWSNSSISSNNLYPMDPQLQSASGYNTDTTTLTFIIPPATEAGTISLAEATTSQADDPGAIFVVKNNGTIIFTSDCIVNSSVTCPMPANAGPITVDIAWGCNGLLLNGAALVGITTP